MKTKILMGLAVFSVAGVFGFAADTSNANATRVLVDFDHPDKFTDANDSSISKDATNSSYLPMLSDYIQKIAPRYLQDGQKLSITFTDIDIAGEYEPWRSNALRDARIVKSIYPPRLKFDFTVTEPNGQVSKSGHAVVSDMNFQMDVMSAVQNDDPVRYEKRLLENWLGSELGRSKK